MRTRMMIAMKKFYNTGIALVAAAILAALILPAQAQEITGTSIVAPTNITDNTVVTDTIQPAGQYGLIDADGGTFNVPSITVGVDDGTAIITYISVIDSVGGGDIVTIDGDVTLTTGATNPDTLVFSVGSSDLGTSDLLSTGIDFKGNIDAGSGTNISLLTADATNADSITLSGTSYNLGSVGQFFLRAANDTLTFDGASAQTFNGNINGTGGSGDIIVNNAAGVTFNGTVKFLDTITIAGSGTDSSATFTERTSANNGITMGDGAGSDTNTLTFDTSNGDFSFSSSITGTAGDTDNIVITGGNTLTGDTRDYNVDNLTVSGSGTLAELYAATTHNISDTVTIGSGATLQLKGDLSAGSEIANSGTLHLETGGAVSVDVTGDISGSGVIDADNDASLTGDVTASSVDVASGKTLATSGAGKTYNVGTTTLHTTSEISFDQNNIVGNFVGDSDGKGTITFTDAAVTQTITGDIGTASKRINIMQTKDDGGALANIVQTTGNINANGIIMGANDTLQFTGNTPQTVNAGISNGTVTVGSGSSDSNVTFSNVVFNLGGFNVMNNASATLTTTFITSGNLSVDGNMTVSQGVSATVADVVSGSTQGNLYLTIGTDGNGNDNSATLFDTGGALDFANLDGTNSNTATLTLKPGTGVITAGQEFLIIDGAATVANFTNGASIADSFTLFDFTVSDGANAALGADDSDIVAIASMVNLAAVTNSDTNANVLEGFIGGVTPAAVAADPVLESVYNSVLSNPDPDDAAESIQAAVDGGLIVAANNFTAANMEVNSARLAALRSDNNMTGIAAGNAFSGAKFWTQAFGKIAEQDRRDNIDGFDLQTYGVALGADKELKNLTFGLAFSYGRSEVNSQNATTTQTNINSYQLSLYGDYDLGHNLYVGGSVYYAYHDIGTTRHNVGGVSGLNANGDFSANQFGARVEAGFDHRQGNILITPKILTNISHYDADSYTETGAGGASLSVDSDAVDVVELGAGVDAKWSLQQDSGAVLEPVLSAGYRHDFVGDEVETNSSFTGTGASFQTRGFEPARNTFSLGASLTYYSTANWDFTADYDYEIKSDYNSHSGVVKIMYKF